MKSQLISLSFVLCLFSSLAFAGETQPNNDESPSILVRAAPIATTVGLGFLAMKQFPEHRRSVVGVMLAASAALSYFDPYSLLAVAGPAYCVAATPYFGHCPCCPPGCMWIMGC